MSEITGTPQTKTIKKADSAVKTIVKTATFDETVPTLGGLKKMQDASRFEKARFRFRLYPIGKNS